jgi:tRNA dimethylallyltransferase
LFFEKNNFVMFVGMSAGILEKEMQELLNMATLPLKKKIPMHHKRKKVILLSGPTGVGKTDLSLIIAKALGGEIISADSMQVYRGMDIGTAKARPEEREAIPHHLIDIRDLNQNFNVVDFYREAHMAIKDILQKDHVPIVVGGTGFYIHALLYGPPAGPASVPGVRARLEKEMEEFGALSLYEKLREIDPDYASTITGGDRHKIIRALEIIALTSQKVSDFSNLVTENEYLYDFRCWFVYMPKEVLYPRIEQRCDRMLEQGFLEEVRYLESLGLRGNLSASQAIGYRQALDFLQTDQSEPAREKFIELFKQASRRYAKRQFTWFRKEPLFRWLNLAEKSQDLAAETILQDFEQTLP